MSANPITYIRTGRKMRGQGSIMETNPATGLIKVKPVRRDWKTIWISATEIQRAGGSTQERHQHHIPAVGKMVDGLRQLLDRKESLSPTPNHQ